MSLNALVNHTHSLYQPRSLYQNKTNQFLILSKITINLYFSYNKIDLVKKNDIKILKSKMIIFLIFFWNKIIYICIA